MMEASLDVTSSDGSVAVCERVLDVSVLGCRWGGGGETMVNGGPMGCERVLDVSAVGCERVDVSRSWM